MTEVELTEPVDLCDERGRLSPAARGWSRRPLHRTNLRGAVGRKKRWDYWCVTAPDLIVAVTYADVDYLGIANVWVLQPSTGVEVLVDRSLPLAVGFALPDVMEQGTMRGGSRGMHLEIAERPEHTAIRVTAASTAHGPLDVDLVVARPAGHESLNVVIPWSERRFQFTTKANLRPVTGTVRLGDTLHELGPESGAFGALDVGRGIWKYSNRWNWASASGAATDGRPVGLQFGGKWTVGTGYTENALCVGEPGGVGGRLHKIHDELDWAYDWDDPLRPWRVRDTVSGRVDATLTPFHDRYSRVSVGVLSMEVHQCFGTWSGTVVTDDGETVAFDGILGFAEEARNRW
ncbi:MAG: DUF2804 domain-containing protein [Acidimicrobiales bacterium]